MRKPEPSRASEALLKRFRAKKNRGLQTKTANEIEVSPGYLSRIARGHIKPNRKTAVALRKFVPLAWWDEPPGEEPARAAE